MNNFDIKTTVLNALILLISFSDVEMILKIILLFTSIIYTFMKIIETVNNKKNGIKSNQGNL